MFKSWGWNNQIGWKGSQIIRCRFLCNISFFCGWKNFRWKCGRFKNYCLMSQWKGIFRIDIGSQTWRIKRKRKDRRKWRRSEEKLKRCGKISNKWSKYPIESLPRWTFRLMSFWRFYSKMWVNGRKEKCINMWAWCNRVGFESGNMGFHFFGMWWNLWYISDMRIGITSMGIYATLLIAALQIEGKLSSINFKFNLA